MSETSKKRVRSNTEVDPETSPHVSEEEKGQPSSRLDASEEPARNEEKQRVIEKLRERERGS